MVRQNDQRVQIDWEEIKEVVETRKCIIIYITAKRAYIFPKSELQEVYSSFTDIISQKVDKKKLKLNKKE